MSRMIRNDKRTRSETALAGTTVRGPKPTTPTSRTSTMMMQMMREMRKTIGRLHLKVAELQDQVHDGQPRDEVCQIQSQPTMYPILDGRLDKPKYPGKNDIHPVAFLEDLFSYLRRIPSREHVIDNIIGCLEGDARRWARVYRQRWSTEEDFKIDFLDTYWGEPEQNLLRKNIVCGVWQKETHKSMMGYFVSLAGQAKMLSTPILESQLVNDLMHHFPREVQYAWRMRRGTTIIEGAEFLRDLDDVDKQSRTAADKSFSQTTTGMKRTMPNPTKPKFLNKKPKIVANLEVEEEEIQDEDRVDNENLN